MAAEDTTRTIAPLFTWRSAIIHSELTPVVRHVLLTLSLYMNEVGGSAYPGSARLSRDTGLHQTTVKRSLSEAVKNGYLQVIKKGGAPHGGKRLATEYAAASPVENIGDWYSTDRGHTTTGGPESRDRGSTVQRPGVQGDPISSLNSSENSGGFAPKDCTRCHGNGSYWDGIKDRECEHTFGDTDEPAPPPWIAAGVSFADWSGRESTSEVDA